MRLRQQNHLLKTKRSFACFEQVFELAITQNRYSYFVSLKTFTCAPRGYKNSVERSEFTKARSAPRTQSVLLFTLRPFFPLPFQISLPARLAVTKKEVVGSTFTKAR